jgi:hypothetical protein
LTTLLCSFQKKRLRDFKKNLPLVSTQQFGGNYSDETSRATLGMSFSSHRLLKIKLFKPENSKNQAFQARPIFFGKLPFPMLNHHLKHLNS